MRFANGQQEPVLGTGSVVFEQGSAKVSVSGVRYVPGARAKLVSVSQLTDSGCTVVFEGDSAVVSKAGSVFMTASKAQGVYAINGQVVLPEQPALAAMAEPEPAAEQAGASSSEEQQSAVRRRAYGQAAEAYRQFSLSWEGSTSRQRSPPSVQCSRKPCCGIAVSGIAAWVR